MKKKSNDESIEIVRERERERELYSREISFVKHVKKCIIIDKDRLYAKIEIINLFLANSLSFLCACGVMETKDKYA